MSEYAAAATSSVLVLGQSAGQEPYSQFGRRDEGPDSELMESTYEHSLEELCGLDQPESYRILDCHGYNSSDYSKWPVSEDDLHPGSPKGPIMHSPEYSLAESPNRLGHTIVIQNGDSEAMGMGGAEFGGDSETHLSSEEMPTERRKKRFRYVQSYPSNPFRYPFLTLPSG
jgi:hypothetical protein